MRFPAPCVSLIAFAADHALSDSHSPTRHRFTRLARRRRGRIVLAERHLQNGKWQFRKPEKRRGTRRTLSADETGGARLSPTATARRSSSWIQYQMRRRARATAKEDETLRFSTFEEAADFSA